MKRSWRPVAILAGLLAVAELSSVVTSRHAPLPSEVLAATLLHAVPAMLFAVALVLVHRASRILNFAQLGAATGAALVFLTFQTQRWPYAVCAAFALGFCVVAFVVVELLLRRFETAPRLVATVCTIAAGQVLISIGFGVSIWRFGSDPTQAPTSGARRGVPSVAAFSPLTRHRWAWASQVFTGDHVAAVIVAVVALGALGVFFRRSLAGIAIRGAAENREKAGSIGIGTGRLSTLSWAAAGLLVGLFVITLLPLEGATLSTAPAHFGIGVLIAGLAAAVMGGLDDLPTTAAAALGIGTLTQAVYFSTTHGAYVDVVLFFVLGLAMLVRRDRFGRAEASLTGGWAAAEEIRSVPPILRGHPSVRSARRWVCTIGAVVILGYPFAMSPSQVVLGATFAIFGIVAISLVVLTGWGGQISLGQFGFVAVGAAIGGAVASHGWPFTLALIAGTVAGGVVAIVVGLPALRLRGLFLAVMTLSFAVVAVEFFLDPNRFKALNPTRVPRPKLIFVDFGDDRAFYFLALAGVAFALFVALGLRRTRTGRVLIAMRDNERAAQAFGLSLVRVRLTTFAISGALAAFAGVLLAAQNRAVDASGFDVSASIQVFLMAIIGGLGSVTGVLTGAVYLACVQLFIHSFALRGLASGVGVVLTLLFFPSGLGGAVYAMRDAFLRRVALRDRIFVSSLLGDLRAFDAEQRRAQLGPRLDTAPTATERTETYELDSEIAHAGRSQRGKGWVYG